MYIYIPGPEPDSENLKLPGLGPDPDLLPGRVPGTFYFSKNYTFLADFPKKTELFKKNFISFKRFPNKI